MSLHPPQIQSRWGAQSWGALCLPQIHTTPCSLPPQPRLNGPAGESGCCGPGGAGRGGVGQSRENQFAKLIESSFVQFCCLEGDVLYSNTCHRRTRGLGTRTGWRGRAQLSCSANLGMGERPCSASQQPEGPSFGGGCPGPRALASRPVLKGATVGTQGGARGRVSFLPAPSMGLASSRQAPGGCVINK